eukprot:TRINITY_DN1036_c0_g1_i2.p1 TRINITY_DN1036_c0_g1~~TRINITY_DN1036_c0_g1_i2.p1  ORF type:complete len:284 (-),score=132.66 TRINITY_DN1036_c0_g1_i2:94-945(-)
MAFWIFGQQKTPKEILRENQRKLQRSIRDIDRERGKLQQQEKTLIVDIKKMAQANQISAAKIMARDLVRTRAHVTKFYNLKSHLQAVSLRIQTLQSTQAMAEAMRGATRAMMVMNRQMNIPAMQRILMSFEMESEKMDMKGEMMGDAIDGIFEEDEEEQDTEEVLNKVFDEIGINLQDQLVNAPQGGTNVKATESRVAVGAAATAGGGGGSGGGSSNNTNNNKGGGGGGNNGGGGGGGLSSGGGGSGPTNGGGGPAGGPGLSGGTGDPEDDELLARFENLKKK